MGGSGQQYISSSQDLLPRGVQMMPYGIGAPQHVWAEWVHQPDYVQRLGGQ